jgi:hypothetical protein
MEKIVHILLESFLQQSNLSDAQHGFTHGRSTVTNLLVSDAHIGDMLAKKHVYDIICFDFVKAFDKVPHACVVKALADLGIKGTTLSWFESFLTDRTFNVRVGRDVSESGVVVSGVIQGSILGPQLYRIYIDPLLKLIKLPKQAFADDLKFVCDVTQHSEDFIQSEIDTFVEWADEHHAPISMEKSCVLHCGRQECLNIYRIRGTVIESVDTVTDLGVVRSSDGSYTAHYPNMIAKARRASGLIRRSFRLRTMQLMWPAFQAYVLPVLMYASSAWSPSLQKDIKAIESVQKRFTKSIFELRHLNYYERLSKLNALTLSNRRLFADMVLTFKIIHSLTSCSLDSLGLLLVTTNTRGAGLRLYHKRTVNKIQSSLFQYRVTRYWNKLPTDIIACLNLHTFKHKLFNYLLQQQSNYLM